MYKEGGCYFITSRILIVDMLDNKIDIPLISGFLIYNAHRLVVIVFVRSVFHLSPFVIELQSIQLIHL